MGNMLAILIGAVCSVLGIVALCAWWTEYFVPLLKGSIGVTLLCGGLLALAIGISEMRAAKEFESAVPPATSSDEGGCEEKADESCCESDASEEKAETTEDDSSDDS